MKAATVGRMGVRARGGVAAITLLTLAAWPLGLVCAQISGAGSIDQRVSALLPSEAENRWLQIPWRADLMRARAEAERSGKPLFLFVMDGNPLGCG